MIRKIFFTDLKNLLHSFFALVIAIGVCFLPALYAWLNIYSNWDPYGNTGNLKVAAYSEDKGFKDDDGTDVNTGEKIIEELHDNTAIDWQFTETKEEAISKVESGEYYAALVVPEDFTYNMYHVFTEKVSRPKLLFYQNQKKNAIASKITDTVAGNLQSKMNEAFIGVITQEVFKTANDVSVKMEDGKTLNSIIEDMKSLRQDITSYDTMIKAAKTGSKILDEALVSAEQDVSELGEQTADSAQGLVDAGNEVDDAKDSINEYSRLVTKTMDSVTKLLKDIKGKLQQAQITNDVKSIEAAANTTARDVDLLRKDLDALSDAAIADATGADAAVIEASHTAMTSSIKSLESVLVRLENASGGSAEVEKKRQQALSDVSDALDEVDRVQRQFENVFVPQLNQSIDGVETVLANASEVMTQMSQTLVGMGDVFSALKITVEHADESLDQTSAALGMIGQRLDTVIEKVEGASSDEKWKVLIQTLAGDPEAYAEFFSEPVTIESSAIYPVENYGSAVTPFYTVLAIWVGALILTAIMKTHPPAENFPGARGYQLFFGRLIIFVILGQLQTAVIVWGDLVLLKVQCLEPLFFWLASAITSFTFTIFIFALVHAFGDVGKALAVVIVVIQIAGSSGTYPIELLPEFFQKVYIFFPFPYAINALRECVGGMYANDYWIYLLQLSVFILVALTVGIWIRRPFASLNHYMEERMEDTEMM